MHPGGLMHSVASSGPRADILGDDSPRSQHSLKSITSIRPPEKRFGGGAGPRFWSSNHGARFSRDQQSVRKCDKHKSVLLERLE